MILLGETTVMTERERILRVLHHEQPDRTPWATRLTTWRTSNLRSKTMPAHLTQLDLMQLHDHLKIGRQHRSLLTRTRLRGVDLTVAFNGDVIHRESNPAICFPEAHGLYVADRPGETMLTFESPAGTARVRLNTNIELINGAAIPYTTEHIITDVDSFSIVTWMLKNAEIVPTYDDFIATDALIADRGFCTGELGRVPFQQILLEFLGIERAVYWMADEPARFQYLLDLLDDLCWQTLEIGLGSPAHLVEFGDNYDGNITSPKLFAKYCIPFLQRAAGKIHARGRLMSNHLDGDIKPLLHLVPEAGIDVAESFSPHPLTTLTFEDAWAAWRGKVIMWGAIPSPIFEPAVPDGDFEAWLERMFDLIAEDKRIILGIGDQAMRPALVERMARVSELLS